MYHYCVCVKSIFVQRVQCFSIFLIQVLNPENKFIVTKIDLFK